MSDDYLNAKIGEGYKEKLREIAEKQERSMTGQIRKLIEDAHEQVKG